MSIDFRKAFNTMCHKNYLEELGKLGASGDQCLMVAAFLRKRIMRVKVGKELSVPCLVPGGAPQGSVLGSFLFCAATSSLGSDLSNFRRAQGILSDTMPFDQNGVDVSPRPSTGSSLSLIHI